MYQIKVRSKIGMKRNYFEKFFFSFLNEEVLSTIYVHMIFGINQLQKKNVFTLIVKIS